MHIKRKGLSPVISQIILAATVLTVGGGVWYFSLGYCSITTDSYIDETIELMSVSTERFTVERVYNNSDGSTLTIWVNNYGDVDITVNVYADSYDRNESTFDIHITSEKMKQITIDFSADPMYRYENFQIKVHSRRQNIAYNSYTVQ